MLKNIFSKINTFTVFIIAFIGVFLETKIATFFGIVAIALITILVSSVSSLSNMVIFMVLLIAIGFNYCSRNSSSKILTIVRMIAIVFGIMIFYVTLFNSTYVELFKQVTLIGITIFFITWYCYHYLKDSAAKKEDVKHLLINLSCGKIAKMIFVIIVLINIISVVSIISENLHLLSRLLNHGFSLGLFAKLRSSFFSWSFWNALLHLWVLRHMVRIYKNPKPLVLQLIKGIIVSIMFSGTSSFLYTCIGYTCIGHVFPIIVLFIYWGHWFKKYRTPKT